MGKKIQERPFSLLIMRLGRNEPYKNSLFSKLCSKVYFFFKSLTKRDTFGIVVFQTKAAKENHNPLQELLLQKGVAFSSKETCSLEQRRRRYTT